MDIHAPDGPIRSLKEFAVHILIVTVGILIAFGLEGLRETWRENRAVSETLASFHQELLLDQQNLRKEVAGVKRGDADLGRLLSDLPQLSKNPQELTKRAESIALPFYFFRTTAWESATARGILARLGTEDLNRFADVYLSIKNYQDAQKGTIPTWLSVGIFFRSRHTLSESDLSAGQEKLLTLQKQIQTLEHLAAEFQGGLTVAIGDDGSPAQGN